METITVKTPTGAYPIHLGSGLLADLGCYTRDLGFNGPCAVVTNPTIGQHYAEPALKSLRDHGLRPVLCEVPDGEAYKTTETVAGLYAQFFEAGLERKSIVLALGGGVVGDMTGFAAATYLRGLPFGQIPTSLLAMVDSSVGGKTGVDLPQGKNMVGAFKQPEMVLIDPEVLSTLPGVEFRSGLAEAVKAGIIGDVALFEAFEDNHTGELTLPRLIADAIRVKVALVQEDPFERGRRAVLNLGHTFGHAFEQLSGYTIRHGEGVAMGMACAARLAARLEYCAPETADRIINLLDHLQMPTQPPAFPPDLVWRAMGADKKKEAGKLRFILPTDIGAVDIFDDVPEIMARGILTA